MTQATEPMQSEHLQTAHRYYHRTALGSGLVRMWRAWRISLPVVLVNAVLQAALIAPTISSPTGGFYDIFAVIASAVILLVSALMIQAAAVESADGTASWSLVWHRSRVHGARFVLWLTALAVGVVLGMLVYMWPGLVVPAVLPFLTVAAVLGERNPIAANFRTIRARPFRWLVTMFIIGVSAAIVWFVMVINWFFVPSVVGAFAACAVGGWLCWWWSTSLTLIYLDASDSSVAS